MNALCKSRYLLLLCLAQGFSLRQAEAQQGLNNFWMGGYEVAGIDTALGGIHLDFITGYRVLSTEDRWIDFFRTSANITDSSGSLLFSTNGVYVANSTGNLMLNGDGLNPSTYTSQHTQHPSGLFILQGSLILPRPDSSGLYDLVHMTLDDLGASTAHYLYHSTVDMSLDNGLGGVVVKNQVLVTDTLNEGRITAVRHANGRDWWVFCFKANSNMHYRMLLTPNGIEVDGTQAIGVVRPPDHGQACFSPDGSRYAYYSGFFEDLEIFDFDRCTGLFSNPVHITIDDYNLVGGLAFSPNSRFVYVSSVFDVYQYDTEAADIESSMVHIAVWDSTYSPFPPFAAAFDIAQLAPDGQVYIGTGNSTLTMHVIHNPDEPGLACNMEQHAMDMPRVYANSLPNHPNYFLGPVVGSVCDSLGLGVGISELEMQHRLQVVPNPSRGSCTVGYAAQPEAGGLEVFDPQGRRVYQSRLAAWSTMHAVQLQDAAPGIYQCRLQWGTRSVSTRIVIAP